jgi:quinoprotein glucose dehydrogenase
MLLMTGRDVTGEWAEHAHPQGASGLKHGIDGYHSLLDSDSYPAIAPPWATLNAIILTSDKYFWRAPFGENPRLVERGMRNIGSDDYWAGIEVARGAAVDRRHKLRQQVPGVRQRHRQGAVGGDLPAMTVAGDCTPAMYPINWRQYVVMGAGGGKLRVPGGSTYVALAQE